MSEYDPNALTDDDVFPWGKWKGERLGDVPDHYWMWFLRQTWCDENPRLVKYAELVADSTDQSEDYR